MTNKQSFRERFTSFLRENGILFALVTLYVTIHGYWEDLIGKQIVDRLLKDYFTANLLNDIIFYCAVLVSIIMFFINWKKLYKQKTIIISLMVVVLWIYYRLASHRFCFTSLYYNPFMRFFDLKYIDIVPINAGVILLSCFLSKVMARNVEFNNKLEFIKDIPIFTIKDDAIRRKEMAHNAVKRLLNTDTKNGSFTFGIDAPWGAGKTSFMNIMKNDIRFNQNLNLNDIITIDFNPWLYASEKDLVTAFMNELSKHLLQLNQTLARNLIDYSKLLSVVDIEETKLAASLMKLSHQDSSLQVKKQQITKAIKGINKRIFVFIDDLDRLDADELMEMMKLIRNISDFPYMYFVAAYDKTYLVQCLDSSMHTKGALFVDKIFQHEFHLPAVPVVKLRELLFNYINNESTGYIKPIIEQYIVKNDNPINPLNALSNIREVKRLANHFTSSYLHVTSLDAIDLLLIELFKMKYPLVYTFFEQKIDEIIVLNDDQHNYRLYRGENDSNHFDFLHYIDLHKKDFNINDIDKRSIQTILDSLFEPTDSNYTVGQRYCRFSNKMWIKRYFHLTELEEDISSKEFEDAINGEFTIAKQRIDDWAKSKQYSLDRHMIKHASTDKEEQKKLIQSIIYCFSKHLFPEIYVLDKAILKLKTYNTNNDFSDDDKAFIKKILMDNRDEANISSYIGHLHNIMNRDDMSLLCDVIIEIEQTIFDRFINQYNEKESDKVLDHFGYKLGIKEDSVTNINLSDNYVEAIASSMRSYAERHIISIIPEIIIHYISYYKEYFVDTDSHTTTEAPMETNFGRQNYYELSYFTRIIWGSWENFYYYISGLDDMNPIIPEFKKFIDLFQKNDYIAVPFSFNQIKVHKSRVTTDTKYIYV